MDTSNPAEHSENTAQGITVDIFFGGLGKVGEKISSEAEKALLDSFRTAANLEDIAARLAIPIQLLTVTGAKVVASHGYDAYKITVAIRSDDPNTVAKEIFTTAIGMTVAPVGVLAGRLVAASIATITGGAGIVLSGVAGAAGGILGSVAASRYAGTLWDEHREKSAAAQWAISQMTDSFGIGLKISEGTANDAISPTDVPPADLAASSMLVLDPTDSQIKIIFNQNANPAIDPNVASGPNTYLVQKGDSLWKIAQTKGWNLDELKAANPQLSDPNFILAGQRINGLPPIDSPTDSAAIDGHATYQFAGTEREVINDKENGGRVKWNDRVLTGGVWREDEDAYVSRDGRFRYTIDGNTLRINGSKTIEQFRNGAFGIFLTQDPVEEIRHLFEAAQQEVSPLILDLDGDGVKTLGKKAGVYFDHDRNGFAEKTGWISRGDGMLVWDKNDNGQIDDGNELFGNNTLLSDGSSATNGFAALSALDENADGKVDANDTAWRNLRIWQDKNSDGRAEADEITTLEQTGVASLGTGFSDSGLVDVHGNAHRQIGSYTKADGTTAAMEDVWFVFDAARTVEHELIAESDDILALPDVEGFGNVHGLRQAMARDHSGNLQALVQTFIATADIDARRALVTDILYHWAGVQDMDPASRSNSIWGNAIGDARKLATLENFLGQRFNQPSYQFGGNPAVKAARQLQVAFDALSSQVYSRLAVQTHYKALFGSLQFRMNGNAIEPDTGAMLGTLRNIHESDARLGLDTARDVRAVAETMGPLGEQLISQWRNEEGRQQSDLLRKVLGGLQYDAYLIGDANDNMLTVKKGIGLIDGGDGDDVLRGGARNDLCYGGAGNDTLHGGRGNDLLDGGHGDDALYGGAGDDRIDGGAGRDYLAGGLGADTYLFGRGSGHDTIHNHDRDAIGVHADTILLGSGISMGDVKLARDGTGLVLSIEGPAGAADTLTVKRYFSDDGHSAYAVENIAFADGSTWDVAAVKEKVLLCTPGNDILHGYATDDVICGGEGNDKLYGEDGNDLLDGGAGNDRLYGGSGSDTYLLRTGSGADLIDDADADIVKLEDVASTQLRGRRRLNQDLVLDYGVADSIRMRNFFAESPRQFSCIQFSDNITWTPEQLARNYALMS